MTGSIHEMSGQLTPSLEKASSGDVNVLPIEPDSEYHEYLALHESFKGERLKKLLWKVDIRLIPVFALLYLMSFLDRGNVGNAKVAGFLVSVPMTDAQYNLALTMFFVFYILVEIPSQMALKKTTPTIWISFITISWGLVMTLHALITSYNGFLVARIFLGLTEGGMMPAASYTLSQWYRRDELAIRVSAFFVAASLAGALSGILAYGIAFLNGKGSMGWAGWQWIFFIEGIMTIAVGVAGPFIILGRIDKCGPWLAPDEKRYLILRQRYTDTGSIAPDEHFSWRSFRNVFTSWHLIPQIIIYIVHSAVGYSISFTLPVIIKSMGWSTIQAYLIPVPIYFGAAITTLINSKLGDIRRSRWIHIVIPFSVGIVGLIILIVTAGKPEIVGVSLFGLILVVLAGYSAVPTSLSWLANNFAGYNRVIAIGAQVGIGNCGGLIGSNIYLTYEAPIYRTGYGASLGLLCTGIVCALWLKFGYDREMKRRDAMTEDEVAAYSDKELAAMAERSPYYRFLV